MTNPYMRYEDRTQPMPNVEADSEEAANYYRSKAAGNPPSGGTTRSYTQPNQGQNQGQRTAPNYQARQTRQVPEYEEEIPPARPNPTSARQQYTSQAVRQSQGGSGKVNKREARWEGFTNSLRNMTDRFDSSNIDYHKLLADGFGLLLFVGFWVWCVFQWVGQLVAWGVIKEGEQPFYITAALILIYIGMSAFQVEYINPITLIQKNPSLIPVWVLLVLWEVGGLYHGFTDFIGDKNLRIGPWEFIILKTSNEMFIIATACSFALCLGVEFFFKKFGHGILVALGVVDEEEEVKPSKQRTGR